MGTDEPEASDPPTDASGLILTRAQRRVFTADQLDREARRTEERSRLRRRIREDLPDDLELLAEHEPTDVAHFYEQVFETLLDLRGEHPELVERVLDEPTLELLCREREQK